MPEGRTRGQTTVQTSDAGGVAQQPHFCTSELPPPRFQCDAAGVGIRVVCLSTGSPSLCSGITRGYAWCASAGGGFVWMQMRTLFCAATAEPEAGVAILCLFLLIPILL